MKTAKDDKIETEKVQPSPAAVAPDTAESAKVKATTIDEKTEVRQSTEQIGTNKVEGEKKIGLAEETKAAKAGDGK